MPLAVPRPPRRRWCTRIVTIISIYEKDTLIPVLPRISPRLDPVEVAGYRPSYRFLSWFLHRRGCPVSGDRLGDHQPERVIARYRDEFAWLPLTPAA
ncbi:hypothetical protein ACE14D_02695 [Streptomyces sp. Act-28]